jgi:hypothetical protein
LNSLDKNTEKAVMQYRLEPVPGRNEAFLEVVLYHYKPNAQEPDMLAISKITCGEGQLKKGEMDLTEPLRAKGYFNK